MQPSHIFVLGTGRSGTCWMGEILGQHAEIESFIEPKTLFDKSNQAAIYANEREKHLPSVYSNIDNLAEQAKGIPAYKVHTMLWFAEQLAERYPKAKFIGMQRSPHACVASMLRHPGVRAWCQHWKRYPLPNEFLGVTINNAKEYGGYTLAQRCARRWVTHRDRMTLAKTNLSNRLLIVDYEQLVKEPGGDLQRIRQFLDLRQSFPSIEANPASLRKWQKHLSKEQIAEIDRVI